MKNLWTEILQMLKGSPKDVRIIGGVGEAWDICKNGGNFVWEFDPTNS